MSTSEPSSLTPSQPLNAQERACFEAFGVLDRHWIDGLELIGPDRLRFLHGRVTCDVQPLEPGQGIYGFAAQIKGRVLADLVVLESADRLWIELPEGTGETLKTHFEKYILADQVEIQPLDQRALTLVGPRAAGVLAELGDLPTAPWGHRHGEMLGTETRLVRHPEPGVPMWTLWADASQIAGLADQLLEHGSDHGAMAIGRAAWDRVRVAAGWPSFGQDFDDTNFPQELEPWPEGFGDAVSYTKGCYLGQEVIARIHYRGGVSRHLRGLQLDSDTGPVDELLGREILHEGRPAGNLTSAVDVHAGDGRARRLGLAILQKRVEPGARVELAGGGSGQVVELPFTP